MYFYPSSFFKPDSFGSLSFALSHLVKAMVFPVVIYGCESCTIKKAERWRIDAVVLEKTLESHLDCKEIRPVHPKGNQSWIFIERTDAKAEALVLWPLDAKSRAKDWRQERGDDRGWDCWIASLTQWTWVWASSRIWWWPWRPGVLQSMGSQSVGHNSDWTDPE